MDNLKTLEYNPDNFANELSNPYTLPIAIKRKKHFIYFQDYLGTNGIDAKTMVVEENYVSKDYLSDYSLYYSLCHTKYPKKCKRIHFFKNSFDQKYILSMLLSTEPNHDFWDNYLGFMVAKPLPYTVIGTTVLKHYNNHKNEIRCFFGIRNYTVHFFGKRLELDSLAFQEQDTVVSACATTAIWSTLHKASIDYSTILKTPSEITKDAGVMSIDGSRLFPNKGLDVFQMCQALEKSGLVSEIRMPKSNTRDSRIENSYVKSLIKAYSRIGIPLILIVSVPTENGYGLHALAVSGYRVGSIQYSSPSQQLLLLSSSIEKIYVHDDQWGPFTRVEFTKDDYVETNWTKHHSSKKNPPTFIKDVIIPIFPKIRISYDDILVLIHGFDRILFEAFGSNTNYDFSWDINLNYSNTYKEDVSKTLLNNDLKLTTLLIDLPKYIWVASCYVGDSHVLDFIFDATDLAKNMICNKVVSYNNDIKTHLFNFIKINPDLNQYFNHASCEKYIQFFLNELSTPS